ncbi:MAG: polynucleotide adenylyltransferase PcnB [Legionellales bacterium]
MHTNHLSLPIHIAPPEHGIQPHHVSPAALEVIAQLHSAGFEAYIVGGGVRDILLGLHPKDFDVATNAHPEEVQKLFKRCMLIGRRFRLAHVHIRHHVIEVATFRGNIINPELDTDSAEPAQEHHTHATTGMVLRDNIYGTFAEDAWRRDFSINALYYNPKTGEIIDFTNGFADLQHRCLRIIGDPAQRYREDPVRMLRALRFISKLNFNLDPESAQMIPELAHLLDHIPPARLFEEFNKLFMNGHALANFHLFQEYGITSVLLPQITEALTNEHGKSLHPLELIELALHSTDARVHQQKPATPAFLFATLLWPAYCLSALHHQHHNHQAAYIAGLIAASEVIKKQSQKISIPKRLGVFIREVWHLQPRLVHPRKRQVGKILRHQRFRAAYDFLLLRAQAGEPYQNAAKWWTDLQDGNEEERLHLLANLPRPDKSPIKQQVAKQIQESDDSV